MELDAVYEGMLVCDSDTIPRHFEILQICTLKTLCSSFGNSQLQLPKVIYWQLNTPDMCLLAAYSCTVMYNSTYCGVGADAVDHLC